MANTDARIGLRPVRYISGAVYNGAVNPYYIASTYGTALFIGDPVTKTGTGNTAAVSAPGVGDFAIGTMPEIEKTVISGEVTAANEVLTGVIVSFAADPTSLENTHNPASTERIAMVCDDPDVVFEIQADDNAAIGATELGLNGNLIFTHGGSTTTGLSGAELDSGTTTALATTNTRQLHILRCVNREDNDNTLVRNNVLVRINAHTETHNRVAVGDGSIGQ